MVLFGEDKIILFLLLFVFLLEVLFFLILIGAHGMLRDMVCLELLLSNDLLVVGRLFVHLALRGSSLLLLVSGLI